MTRIKQPATSPGPVENPAAKPEPRPLTLRKDVLVPPKAQINAWADQVNERILKLDAWAVRLGTTFGLASDPFDMTPAHSGASLPEPEREGALGADLQRYLGDKTSLRQLARYGLAQDDSDAAIPGVVQSSVVGQAITATLLLMIKGMTPTEQVTLEQREGRWGLYFYRGPASFGPSAATAVKPSTVPLKDAPLAVRERFLRRSEAFFRRYIETTEERLATVKESVEGGDAALAMLEQLSLK